MKLGYEILWIDNDIYSIYVERGEVNKLKEYIVELGFEPNIVTLEGQPGLSNALNQYNFDLIISDYNLDDVNGDEIVKYLRDQGMMTEILFYSANDKFLDDADIQRKIAFLDRISFHSGREGLIDKIEELIKLTVKKLLELNATRGIIMASTSSLDVLIEDITIELSNKHLNKEGEELDIIIESYIEKSFGAKKAEKLSMFYKEQGFDAAFKKMEAVKKWEVFRKFLKELNKVNENEIYNDFIEINSSYQNEVINIRNKFAHAKAEEINGKLVLKGQDEGNDFEVTEEDCISIRKNLIKHTKSFEKLNNDLKK